METNINKILELCEKELRTYKKKWVVDTLGDVLGYDGIIYLCLDSMTSSGNLKYPTIYKYRKQLIKHLKQSIKNNALVWERKQ